jgi:colanic acid biosynthesis glycosyl transferase WcaI
MTARVVFVNRFFFPDLSATSQMLSDLATRLAGAGVEVHVVCSRQLYEDPEAELPANEIVDGVVAHRVWTARFGRSRLWGRALDYASFYLTATLLLVRLVRRGDVLVVKTDPPMFSIPGALVASLRGASLINWLQDVFPEVASHLGAARLPRFVESLLIRVRDRSVARATANIVLGTRMRDYFISRGIDRDRLCIIENWADGDAVQAKPAAHSTLRRQCQLQDQFVIMYSGNLGRAHEIEAILRAAEILRTQTSYVFLMVGGGANMRALEAKVRECRLDNFRFLPYQSREALSDSLAAADVHLLCLLPALEGFIFPSKLYGILAAGRPALFIGDASGEIAAVLREGACGSAVRCGDGIQLARELQSLCTDPRRAELMGQRARSLFEARYTLEAAFAKWVRLLTSLGVCVAMEEGASPIARRIA